MRSMDVARGGCQWRGVPFEGGVETARIAIPRHDIWWLTKSKATAKGNDMQDVADISRASGRYARSLAKEFITSIVTSYAILTAPLVLIALVMSLPTGVEAWNPLWWYLEGSTPIVLQLAFWLMLLPCLLAIVTALGQWCQGWSKTRPRVCLWLIRRVRGTFWWVTSTIATSPIAPAFHRSSVEQVFLTVPSPNQKTLLTAVGLTSVARRLQ